MKELSTRWTSRLLPVLLVLLLPGARPARADGVGPEQCGPRDLTPECCLKVYPGDWERCTGAASLAERARQVGLGVVAVATAGALALQPRPFSCERRGAELAADVLSQLESGLKRCAREAERYAHKHNLEGNTLDAALCGKVKVPATGMLWQTYLGLRMHEEAMPCIRALLERLLPKGRSFLEPRFYLNPKTGLWEYMDENFASQIVAQLGWSGLKETIRPDIVIIDESGRVLYVYDLKFPCPPGGWGSWHLYKEGRWMGWSQEDLYEAALSVKPLLVSPSRGVQRK